MAIPTVNVEWVDQSDIPQYTVPAEDNLDRPIYMSAMTADKGPEEWMHALTGKEYFDYFGDPSFAKHGQASIQNGQIAQTGGLLTVRRVVASDSMLANMVLVANVEKTSEQETDASGIYLWQYTHPTSGAIVQISSSTLPVADGTVIPSGVTITPVMVDATQVTFSFKNYEALGNKIPTFAKAARATYDAVGKPAVGTSGEYPLLLLAETGRGVSNKRFRIYQDTSASYPVRYYKYFIDIIENGIPIETFSFSLNPDRTEANMNISFDNVLNSRSRQVRAYFFEDIYEDFIENIEYISGQDNFENMDPIFGADLNGIAIKHFHTNASPTLDSAYGIPLMGGSNGSFGDAPAKLAKGTTMNIVDIALKAAFSGNTDDGDDIYDLDNNRVDVIFDADYHQDVKRAIEDLVNFREDMMYFRDFGLNCNNITDMQMMDAYQAHSRFCASYMNNYMIYEPYSRKKVQITVTYDLAKLFVAHFLNGRNRPFCGQKYGIVIPGDDFVKGSLNFCPKRKPTEDQRKIFDTMRINYIAIYDRNILTMNTEYTSQTRLTQLSWINNVLAVQEMIKAIRVLCPKIRYSFLDGNDLVQYRKDVRTMVIDKYADRFLSCDIEYVEDAIYASNKILYARIFVRFRNFVQTETFKIIALQS